MRTNTSTNEYDDEKFDATMRPSHSWSHKILKSQTDLYGCQSTVYEHKKVRRTKHTQHTHKADQPSPLGSSLSALMQGRDRYGLSLC